MSEQQFCIVILQSPGNKRGRKGRRNKEGQGIGERTREGTREEGGGSGNRRKKREKRQEKEGYQ